MTLDGDAQLARFALDDAGKVALALHHQFLDCIGGCEQPVSGGAEFERATFSLEQLRSNMFFQGFDLVRKGGLGEVQSLSRFREIPSFSNRD